MRNRRKLFLLLLVVLCCAAFAGYYYWRQQTVDRVPPEIILEQDELRLSISDPAEHLLDGVRATDAHDGDVTDSLVVEGVRGVVADRRFTVTYAAFDAAGNVAKSTRTVYYKDYSAPRFSLTAPLIFRSGVSPDVFGAVHAQDVIDGDMTKQIKGTLVTGERRMPEAGNYTVEFRVTNSLGDTAYLAAPVELVADWSNATSVTLSEYLIYLKKGAAFVPEKYLVAMVFGGQTIPLDGTTAAEILVESEVNTAVPGTYRVDYTVTYEQHTARTRLLVVVEG